MSTVCYSPIKGVDDVIADKVMGWDSYRVATLRGMYDESHDSPVDTSDLDKAAEQLVSYRKELAMANAKAMRTTSSNLSETYDKLKKTFTAKERFDRVNMIATLFSDRIDAIQEANPSLSRKAICNGFTSNGKQVAGQFAIFEGVYNDLLDEYSTCVEDGNTEDAEKFKKVLENWASLSAFARMRLRDTEELKLGNSIEYADDANPDNYGDNKLSELFDAETSRRESWQETSDMQSSFGSVGKQVRKLIGTTPRMENGETVYDDLGYPEMLDPVKTHQTLLEMLRGVTSESGMMKKLNRAAETQSWLQPVIDALNKDNQLRTQFFTDFKKNFQLYSILLESVEKGIRVFKTKILNRTDNSAIKQYMTRISLGKVLNSANSLFNKEGKVNWANIKKFNDLVEEYLTPKKTTGNDVFDKTAKYGDRASAPKFYTRGIPREEQKRVIINLTEALGINVDGTTLDKIMSSGRDLHTLTNNLQELVKYGFNSVLTKEEQEKLSNGKFSELSDMAFKQMYAAKEAKVKEKIGKILNVVTKNREGLRLESQVRHKDRNGNGVTLFSNVIPSYLGDKLDRIQSFVEEGDMEGLKKMLQTEYFDSSFFSNNGVILNKWMEELFNSTADENSFASMFKFKRFLGTTDNNFENFTSKQHAIDMFSEYFSERQVSNNSKYAWYPVFILGDSGVAKYIRAKRYDEKEILDGLFNVYRQERRRMAQTVAANQKLKSEGYGTIDNFSSKENSYTILPFLNRDFVANDKTVGKYALSDNPTEQEVKAAIQSYMIDAVKAFKTSVSNLGLLEQDEKSKTYTYFNQEVQGGKTIDDVLKDFYWNTKFATIQQIQMFTVDPAFYAGTKDLQKRYKEIHAPGSILSLEAKDKDGKPYSEDGIERAVYFKDINVDAAQANPEFMQAIASYFGKDSDIYKTYKKNTLTDGQGYRTLDSYRKVMGMAGRWTEDMQKTYDAIKSIRSRYGEEDTIPSDELKEVAKLAVVFQPIKPYMFTIENYPINPTEKLKVPVQHKYAEAVLIPELLPAGSKLRHLAYWMEGSNVDLVGSTKIVKVGGFGATDISKATSREELNAALDKGYVHQLSYSDYRIQSNIPEHVNSSQLFGTQVRKLIMANIKAGDYHYESYTGGKRVNLGGHWGSVRMNGNNLVSFYNALIVSNILESYDKFADSVKDTDRLSDRLLQATISNSRESMDNMLAYSLTGDKEFLVPLFEGGLEHDSAAMLFSIFKKMVNKQAIKGGAAVQVSAMGITGYKEDGDLKYVADPENPNNIKYAECEIPFDLKFTDTGGVEHSLNFEDWCNPDGTLKLEEAEDTSGEYTSYIGKDGKAHRPLIESKYPNILSLLAYRIPTERDYSMINLRIKRFSQKTAGGTIKVPPQGTTIAGFDFDIDKLYLMRYEFKAKPISKEKTEEIWKDFYNDNPSVKRALKAARETSENVQDLISELFSQFTHSELAKDIADTNVAKDRLYKYWKQAGLEGSPREAISKYITEHAERYNLEFEDYDYDKPPMSYIDDDGNKVEGNSRAVRNNMLIHLIQSRLSDPETFEERYTPGGFVNASHAARTLRELLFGDLSGIISNGKVDFDAIAERAKDKSTDPEPNYDPSDPMTIITYNQQNQVAGKLIGIFANQNTNHAFASLMESFNLKEPIAFGSHAEGLSDFLHKGNSKEIDLNLAEFLAASVDAVKDPVLNFLNLNTITADAGAMLSRLGYSTTDIGLLFNQPIIKEICGYAFNNSVDVSMAMREITSKYMTEGVDIPQVNPATDLSSNTLAINIANDRVLRKRGGNAMDNNGFKIGQLQVAELFSQILKDSDDITQFISASKFTASNAVGSTFGDLYAQQMKVSNYVRRFMKQNGKSQLSVEMKVTPTMESPINNDETLDMDNQSYLERLIGNPFAYEQAMFDMNRKAKRLLTKYYPYDTNAYRSSRERLASLTRGGTLDADTINSIHSDMMSYMLAQQEDTLFNGELPIQTPLGEMTSREYYTKHFAVALYNTLEENPEMKNLPIFQYMQFETDEKTGDVSMNVQNIGGLAPYQKDELRDSWTELYQANPNLARDLFMYNFFKLGFTFSPRAFMNLAPTEVKLGIKAGYTFKDGKWVERSYIDFLNEVKDGLIDVNPNRFAVQYILNHLDNRRLVFTAKGKTLKYLKSLSHKAGMAQNSFTLDVSKLGDDAKVYTINDNSIGPKQQAFRPCIVIDGAVYMASGNEDRFNVSSDGTMEYVKVNKLGTSNVSMQYTSETQSSREDTSVETSENGNTSIEPDSPLETLSFNKDEAINEITGEMVKALVANGSAVVEEAEDLAKNIKAALSNQSDVDLQQGIQAIRNAERKNGIVVLDEEGNPKKCC